MEKHTSTAKECRTALNISTSQFFSLVGRMCITRTASSDRHIKWLYSMEEVKEKYALYLKKRGTRIVPVGTLILFEERTFAYEGQTEGLLLFAPLHRGAVLRRAKKQTFMQSDFASCVDEGIITILR